MSMILIRSGSFAISLWAVPCGSPPKATSTSSQSTSSEVTSGGRSRLARCGKTCASAWPAWPLAISVVMVIFGMTGGEPDQVGAGIAAGAEHRGPDLGVLAMVDTLGAASGLLAASCGLSRIRGIAERRHAMREAASASPARPKAAERRERLALGELEALSGLGLAVLLALDGAGVAGEEPALFQRRREARARNG